MRESIGRGRKEREGKVERKEREEGDGGVGSEGETCLVC